MSDMDELTVKQQQVLDYIKEHISAVGYPPSVRDICKSVGLRSTSTAHGYLARLEKKGLIRRDPSLPRAIEVLDPESEIRSKVAAVPVVGYVAAGQPILANENIEEYLPLPQSLVHRDETFLLKVSGDSMIDIGILNGDLILVHHQETAENGDIVVALLDTETTATVKRFYKENGHFRLQPENSTMEPIIVDDVHIAGKVIGLIRSFE
jgi:repressor LexA